MDDYKANAAAAEAEFKRRLAALKKKPKKSKGPAKVEPVKVSPPEPAKPVFIMPTDLVGKTVIHKAFGNGVITETSDTGSITVLFSSVGEKKLGYKMCIDNRLLEVI